MYDYLPPFLAVHADGTVILFRDADELCRSIGWLSANGGLGDHHYIGRTEWEGAPPAVRAAWVLRDDAGRAIAWDDLDAHMRAHSHRGPSGGLYATRIWLAAQAAARGLPIPHTGRRNCAGWMRLPRTLQEVRARAALKCDRGELPVPAASLRTRKFLPTAYDDIPRHREKSWKRHRRHQWKAH